MIVREIQTDGYWPIRQGRSSVVLVDALDLEAGDLVLLRTSTGPAATLVQVAHVTTGPLLRDGAAALSVRVLAHFDSVPDPAVDEPARRRRGR